MDEVGNVCRIVMSYGPIINNCFSQWTLFADILDYLSRLSFQFIIYIFIHLAKVNAVSYSPSWLREKTFSHLRAAKHVQCVLVAPLTHPQGIPRCLWEPLVQTVTHARKYGPVLYLFLKVEFNILLMPLFWRNSIYTHWLLIGHVY